MYTNETVLTPLLRYVFWCIERDESQDFSQACTEIRALTKESLSTGICFRGGVRKRDRLRRAL